MLWIVGIFAVIGLGVLWGYWRYKQWLKAVTARASADSQIVQTRLGQVEYEVHGRGPTVLHFHGGNVGHNGWFMLEHVAQDGFQLLTPDRPGYLATPLQDNGSPKAQADLMAALLDELGIEEVAVVGVSAGGPVALQFALNYPNRVKALILLSAITRQTGLSSDQLNSTLGRLVMSRRFQNLSYFLIYQAMKRMPSLALQDYVRTETTYEMEAGKKLINQMLQDPDQRQQVMQLANAMVPALPRFEGVMNDLDVQQTLEAMPLADISVPTLIVHSQFDGDVPYENALFAKRAIPHAEHIPVEQFGHMIWWGDTSVTQAFQTRINALLHEVFPS